MATQRYSCAKCGHTEHEDGEIRTTGSGLSRFFDIQRHKFTTVTCKQCGYTDLYKRSGSGVGNIVDLFLGG
jgi:predicted nucleic-acid-binding Zn-ribbon protein